MVRVVTLTLYVAYVYDRNLSAMSNQQADFQQNVQDGGSTDSTDELVARYCSRYNVRFYQIRDSGIYDGVLRGMARGGILAWLGADDFYLLWPIPTVEIPKQPGCKCGPSRPSVFAVCHLAPILAARSTWLPPAGEQVLVPERVAEKRAYSHARVALLGFRAKNVIKRVCLRVQKRQGF